MRRTTSFRLPPFVTTRAPLSLRSERGVDRRERLALGRGQAHAAEADAELRGIEPVHRRL